MISSSSSSGDTDAKATTTSTNFIIRIRHSKGMKRINVAASDTVADLKRKVKAELNIPASRQKLSVGSIGLERDGARVMSILNHGEIVTLSALAAPKRARASDNSNSDAKSGKRKKQKGKSAKRDGPEVYAREGSSPEEIAKAIRLFDAGGGLEKAGERVFLTSMKEYRLSSATSDKYQITECLVPSDFSSQAVSRGEKFLSVQFSHARKKMKEIVVLYDEDTIEAVIKEAVRNHTTPKRTTFKSSVRAIGAQRAAYSSPPLFWSVCHSYPDMDVSEAFKSLIQSALEEFKKGIEEENGI
eukprot:CAMPEP_0185258154 /NCGR_PEP_ID=MMETSP1359-20130426/7119_1 /TAXON_ID=552665 /ORGANISM="Bigelowiella longifila, Strain CCMP242" /LENGTH=299 /DNA_ID=CAMNT_0027843533 /DNA_START=101 /DNA_END=1000 /DNA_ORIENTATION=+